MGSVSVCPPPSPSYIYLLKFKASGTVGRNTRGLERGMWSVALAFCLAAPSPPALSAKCCVQANVC